MESPVVAPLPDARAGKPKGARPLRSAWRRIRKSLAGSPMVRSAVVSLLTLAIRFIYRTNRRAEGSDDVAALIAANRPIIGALWHGQHLLGPSVNPRGNRLVAMFSRSADAELNAQVAERLGFEVVRGSGGREGGTRADKGGARALLTLRKVLEGGDSVAMIADIPHGKPREAGLGIVTLARISGRPIFPVAIATSRRKVIESSWDKTTINLPFGRHSVVVGELVYVPAGATAEEMEEKRREVTASLNAATAKAYALVDGKL